MSSYSRLGRLSYNNFQDLRMAAQKAAAQGGANASLHVDSFTLLALLEDLEDFADEIESLSDNAACKNCDDLLAQLNEAEEEIRLLEAELGDEAVRTEGF